MRRRPARRPFPRRRRRHPNKASNRPAPRAMLPVIALVGRPNVGKSTLFNVLTGTRDAIVADVPGLTRDRQYGFGRVGPVPCVLIDTGGLIENPTGIEAQMRAQTERAVAEADRLIFVTDARAGLSPQDQFVARELRRSGKPVTLALNKSEGLDSDVIAADFHALGLGAPRIPRHDLQKWRVAHRA